MDYDVSHGYSTVPSLMIYINNIQSNWLIVVTHAACRTVKGSYIYKVKMSPNICLLS